MKATSIEAEIAEFKLAYETAKAAGDLEALTRLLHRLQQLESNMNRSSKIAPIKKGVGGHKGTMLLQGVPATTKAAFKAACAARGISMRDAFILFMRRFAKTRQLGIDPNSKISAVEMDIEDGLARLTSDQKD